MMHYGPDGHTDGSDKITEYILSIRQSEQQALIEALEGEKLNEDDMSSVVSFRNEAHNQALQLAIDIIRRTL